MGLIVAEERIQALWESDGGPTSTGLGAVEESERQPMPTATGSVPTLQPPPTFNFHC